MRYIIGIDLGTTNSCVAYVDTKDFKQSVQLFKIPQLCIEGSIDSLSTLPSFCYLAAAHEWPPNALNLPWQQNPNFFVGTFARTQGAKVPTRLVRSAKSWLCHPAANRRDKILPVEAADENGRISPLEATARYLRHLREAWNAVQAKGDLDAEFDNQDIVLTVPASFDEVARTLTVEAARMAGFTQMTLLEEPQAAFYSWIAQHENKWQQLLKPGNQILVCDVGGGTTDFSLIKVVSIDGKLTFQRMAVGNHLLLGGDNIDAAIAHLVEDKLSEKGNELNSVQRMQLLHQARQAKETLLPTDKDKDAGDTYRVVLQGVGSSVVQGTLTIKLGKQEVQQLILDGFFGLYSWDDALKLRKTTGLRTMGLPYEDEPSITKHLARFLCESSRINGRPEQPDYVLFNGGTMKPMLFQEAIMTSLKKWFPETTVSTLHSFNLDVAVARGAAYYGKARRGQGVKIGGGIARGYYLILDTQDDRGNIVQKALTLLARGCEEGTVYEPSTEFLLMPNTPVSFQLCSSHVRLKDASGDLIECDPEQMQLLPTIQTVLRFGKQGLDALSTKIPVRLHVELTPIGTLSISLKSVKTEHRWLLEFQLRSATGQENSLEALNKREEDQTLPVGFLKPAEALILEVYGAERGTLKPERLMEKIEEILAMPRKEWPPSILRGLADIAIKTAPQRKLSTEYGRRWWNLVGFLLRPGFGYSLDDYRIKELWKVFLSDFKSPINVEIQIQMWICYRRIAGGLNKGQQTQLASDLTASVLSKNGEIAKLKNKSDHYLYSEKIRALGSFELLENALKVRLGNALVNRISAGEGVSADYWALGRIGARHLFYGTIVNVIGSEICQQWIEQLISAKIKKTCELAFMLGQLARKTAHRELNLSQVIINRILDYFNGTPFMERLKELLLNDSPLTQNEQDQAFGEKLPSALILQVQT